MNGLWRTSLVVACACLIPMIAFAQKINVDYDKEVNYHAALDEQKALHGWASGPRWNSIGTVSVDTILVGELVVDIYDAATEQLLWRGLVSDTASDKAEKNEKKINNAVAKLFKQFPPATGASRN